MVVIHVSTVPQVPRHPHVAARAAAPGIQRRRWGAPWRRCIPARLGPGRLRRKPGCTRISTGIKPCATWNCWSRYVLRSLSTAQTAVCFSRADNNQLA
jgi:hypothetical protein